MPIQIPKVALGNRAAVSVSQASASLPPITPVKALQPRPGSDVAQHGHTIAPAPDASRRWPGVPKSFGQLLAYIVGSWAALSVFALCVSLFSTLMSFVALAMFLMVTAATVQQIYLLMRARQLVLSKKDVSLLWGFVRLIAWDPVEGVLFLQNKSLGFADDNLHDGRGGVQFMYPILGEELALRVPLEVQTLQFRDEKVLTREYLSITVIGTVKWRIVDIRKFYLLVSRELRTTTDAARPTAMGYTSPGAPPLPISHEQEAASSITDRMNLAIMWLRVLTEEQTRMVVSRVSSGLLIADRLATELPELKAATQDRSLLSALAAAPPQAATPEWNGAVDGLARSIYEALGPRVLPYGIAIEDVSLRELRLPDDVVEQCARAAKSAYLPLVAQREAAAEVAVKRAKLAAEVELLGKDAVATRQIVAAAPAYALADFLNEFVKKGLAPHVAASLAATAATAGLAGPGAPPALPPATPTAGEQAESNPA